MTLSILHLVALPFPSPHPLQRTLRTTARALAAEGHRVAIACFHRGAGPAPREVDVIRGPRTAGGSRAIEAALLARTVVRLLARRPVDVIHAHGGTAVLLAALTRGVGSTTPIVADLDPSQSPLPRWLARRCAAAVAFSSSERDALLGFGLRRVAVIPPGVDLLDLAGGRADRARSRWQLGDGPWILSLGGGQPSDRPLEEVPGAGHLVLGGVGPSSERVRFVAGNDPEHLRDALALAALAVVPGATWRAFPLELLTCLGSGLAVVSEAESAGLPGVVRATAGEHGAVVSSLLADPGRCLSLGRAGREAVAAGWSAGRTADALARLYRELLPEN